MEMRINCELSHIFLRGLIVDFSGVKLKVENGAEMSTLRGDDVIAWLERWGERFLGGSQPELYQMLLLHVGATDKLRKYSGADAYWQYVQAILDCFFSAAERTEMCADLMKAKHVVDDPGCASFLHQAKAEIRCRELIEMIEAVASIRTSLRPTSTPRTVR